MKWFFDTADVKSVEPWLDFVDGITTNPSLIAKLGRPFHDVIRDMCVCVQGPVSAEITELHDEVLAEKQARELASISPHVVIKVPMTPFGLRLGKKLVDSNIPINVTLCFSVAQALLAAKIGATYVSPFIGRLDDCGADGMGLISDIQQAYASYPFHTEVLAASIRSVQHVEMAARLGADVATIPPSLMDKMFAHPLTKQGIEIFDADWRKSQQN